MFFNIKLFIAVSSVLTLVTACHSIQQKTSVDGVYRCDSLPDEQTITISVTSADPHENNISIMGDVATLQPTKAETGQRFMGTTKNDIPVVFIQQSGNTTLILNGGDGDNEQHFTCNPILFNLGKDIMSFKALGNEPDWSLVISDMAIEFDRLGKTPIKVTRNEFQLPKTESNRAGMHIVRGNDTLDIVIENKICTDNMSGQIHGYTVQLKYNDKTFNGCGFNMTDPTQALLPI